MRTLRGLGSAGPVIGPILCLFAASSLSAETFLILPFFNLSQDASIQWIGESLSETVRETLAAEGVLALDRQDREEAYRRLSVRPYSQITQATVMRLGEVLDADQIIYGSFRYTPPDDGVPKPRGTLRISAHILNLRKATRGPEYSEIGALEDLARLQTHFAWQTLRFVRPKTAPSEEEFRARHPAIRVDAIENYIRGLLAATPGQKQHLLQQAVHLDARYSQASFQLAKTYFDHKSWRLAADQFAKVARWDAHFREANFFLGLCRYRLNDFAGARESFAEVAEAVPLNEVWNNLGAAESRLNASTALLNFQKAMEGDPTDPDYQFNVGYALFRQGDFEKAAERFRGVLERNPSDTDAASMLARCSAAQNSRKAGPLRSEGLERLKEAYEESAWQQLKAVLEPKR